MIRFTGLLTIHHRAHTHSLSSHSLRIIHSTHKSPVSVPHALHIVPNVQCENFSFCAISWTITSTKFIIKCNLNLSLRWKSFILILIYLCVYLFLCIQRILSRLCTHTHMRAFELEPFWLMWRMFSIDKWKIHRSHLRQEKGIEIICVDVLLLNRFFSSANDFLKCTDQYWMVWSPTAIMFLAWNVSKVTTTVIFQGAMQFSGTFFALKWLEQRHKCSIEWKGILAIGLI